MQARKRERETAEAEARRPPPSADTFHTPMEVDDANARIQAVELRTKKADGQRELQAAFRTSFNQAKLVEAVRGRAKRFVTAERDTSIDGEEHPPPAPAHAVSTAELDDGSTTGRMSRLSLHEDDIG